MKFNDSIKLFCWALIFFIYSVGGGVFFGRIFLIINEFLLLSFVGPYTKAKFFKKNRKTNEKKIDKYLFVSWASGFFVYMCMWMFNFPELNEGLLVFNFKHILLQLLIWQVVDFFVMEKTELLK